VNKKLFIDNSTFGAVGKGRNSALVQKQKPCYTFNLKLKIRGRENDTAIIQMETFRV
jgi:hypothetical protein